MRMSCPIYLVSIEYNNLLGIISVKKNKKYSMWVLNAKKKKIIIITRLKVLRCQYYIKNEKVIFTVIGQKRMKKYPWVSCQVRIRSSTVGIRFVKTYKVKIEEVLLGIMSVKN